MRFSILASKLITEHQLEKILVYRKTSYLESNDEVLDSVRSYDVNLRVPMEFKSSCSFTHVKCRLAKHKHFHGHLLIIELKNYNSILAPFAVGLFLGILVFAFFLPLWNSLLIGVIMSLIMGIVFNFALWIKAPEIAQNFLEKLVKKAVERKRKEFN